MRVGQVEWAVDLPSVKLGAWESLSMLLVQLFRIDGVLRTRPPGQAQRGKVQPLRQVGERGGRGQGDVSGGSCDSDDDD